jgi:hypothetical protein
MMKFMKTRHVAAQRSGANIGIHVAKLTALLKFLIPGVLAVSISSSQNPSSKGEPN